MKRDRPIASLQRAKGSLTGGVEVQRDFPLSTSLWNGATVPKLLMLDEPFLGLAPLMVNDFVPVIQDIKERGKSFLLVEQNIPLARRVGMRGYVLQVGPVVIEGETMEFENNSLLKDTYFGGKASNGKGSRN